MMLEPSGFVCFVHAEAKAATLCVSCTKPFCPLCLRLVGSLRRPYCTECVERAGGEARRLARLARRVFLPISVVFVLLFLVLGVAYPSAGSVLVFLGLCGLLMFGSSVPRLRQEREFRQVTLYREDRAP
jgi:hypothetical protein